MLKLKPDQILDFWYVSLDTGIIMTKIRINGLVRPYKTIGTLSNGYMVVSKNINYKKYTWYIHHLVWVAAGNSWPTRKECIHHLNENRIDNRLCNLKLMAVRDHTNYHTGNDSNMRNIYWFDDRQKWRILIGINGQLKDFGSYEDIDEAKAARDQLFIDLIDKGLL